MRGPGASSVRVQSYRPTVHETIEGERQNPQFLRIASFLTSLNPLCIVVDRGVSASALGIARRSAAKGQTGTEMRAEYDIS